MVGGARTGSTATRWRRATSAGAASKWRNIDPDEVLVVNSVFHFRTLMDESVVVDRLSPRDLVLNTIRVSPWRCPLL